MYLVCSCYTGFTGTNCSQPTCTTMNNCSNHGACIEAEFCKCDMGYNGTDCSNFSCEAVNSCSGNIPFLFFFPFLFNLKRGSILCCWMDISVQKSFSTKSKLIDITTKKRIQIFGLNSGRLLGNQLKFQPISQRSVKYFRTRIKTIT